MTTQNESTLDDGAPAPGLGALARLKLSRELATIKTDLAAGSSVLARLKLVARANAIRTQLGGGVTPAKPATAEVADAPVRAGDMFRYSETRIATVMEVLPGGRAQLRISGTRNGKSSLSVAEVPVRDVKQWPRLGRAVFRDGIYELHDAPVGASNEAPELAELREVIDGRHDGAGLDALLAMIEKAAHALYEADALTGDAEQLAHDAVTHWARLELQTNE